MCRQMHHYSFTQLIDSAEIGLKEKTVTDIADHQHLRQGKYQPQLRHTNNWQIFLCSFIVILLSCYPH